MTITATTPDFDTQAVWGRNDNTARGRSYQVRATAAAGDREETLLVHEALLTAIATHVDPVDDTVNTNHTYDDLRAAGDRIFARIRPLIEIEAIEKGWSVLELETALHKGRVRITRRISAAWLTAASADSRVLSDMEEITSLDPNNRGANGRASRYKVDHIRLNYWLAHLDAYVPETPRVKTPAQRKAEDLADLHRIKVKDLLDKGYARDEAHAERILLAGANAARLSTSVDTPADRPATLSPMPAPVAEPPAAPIWNGPASSDPDALF